MYSFPIFCLNEYTTFATVAPQCFWLVFKTLCKFVLSKESPKGSTFYNIKPLLRKDTTSFSVLRKSSHTLLIMRKGRDFFFRSLPHPFIFPIEHNNSFFITPFLPSEGYHNKRPCSRKTTWAFG